MNKQIATGGVFGTLVAYKLLQIFSTNIVDVFGSYKSKEIVILILKFFYFQNSYFIFFLKYINANVGFF